MGLGMVVHKKTGPISTREVVCGLLGGPFPTYFEEPLYQELELKRFGVYGTHLKHIMWKFITCEKCLSKRRDRRQGNVSKAA